MYVARTLVLFYFIGHNAITGEIWEKDMSEEVFLPFHGTGYENVKLECLANVMRATVDLEEEFEGVFYTRGSYKAAKPPCYFDAEGQKQIYLEIPFNDCKTKTNNDGSFVNTVILQHDDILMFPGDAAFEIACNQTQEFKVMASIGLADPDPSNRELKKHEKSTVQEEEWVHFTPDDIRPRKKKKEKKKKKRPSDEL